MVILLGYARFSLLSFYNKKTQLCRKSYYFKRQSHRKLKLITVKTILFVSFFFLSILFINAQQPGLGPEVEFSKETVQQKIINQVDLLNERMRSEGLNNQRNGVKKQLDGFLLQKDDPITQQFENDKRVSFSYNANGQMTLFEEESWTNTGLWRPVSRLQNTYNNQGFLIETVISEVLFSTLAPTYRYQYNTVNGLVEEVIYSVHGFISWDPSTKMNFTYDNQGIKTETLIYAYSNNQWNQEKKENYFYTSTGQPNKTDFYFWDNNSQWTQNIIQEWTYDSLGREVLDIKGHYPDPPIEKCETTYNGNHTSKRYFNYYWSGAGYWLLENWYIYFISSDGLTRYTETIDTYNSGLAYKDYSYFDSLSNLVEKDYYNYTYPPNDTSRSRTLISYNDSMAFNNLILPFDHLRYFESSGQYDDCNFQHQRLVDSTESTYTNVNLHRVKTYYWSDSSNPTANEEVLTTGLLVYPNPAKDYLNIELPTSEHASIELYNSLGQLVKQSIIKDQGIQIANLAAGWYSYLIIQGDYQYSGKVVVE